LFFSILIFIETEATSSVKTTMETTTPSSSLGLQNIYVLKNICFLLIQKKTARQSLTYYIWFLREGMGEMGKKVVWLF
jgi:hypothetical protein